MKKIVLTLLLTAVIFACNSKPEGYEIIGDLRGDVENGTQVFLKKIGPNNQPVEVDTATVQNGKFSFTGTQSIPEMHLLFLDKIQGYTSLILENGEITYSAQKDSLGFAEIKGTVQNDFFADYMEQSRAIAKKAQSISEDMQAADEAKREALGDEMGELQEE